MQARQVGRRKYRGTEEADEGSYADIIKQADREIAGQHSMYQQPINEEEKGGFR